MSEARATSPFGTWAVAQSPVKIDYSLVVIEEIRHEVLEGFQRLSRGGVEVGGILYGTHDGTTTTIQAMRPIECEHARGPAFLLSDKDRKALEEQLRRDAEDPRLEGMKCLGWFLSHTRSEIVLSDSDLEIYNHYFGAPWQVTLVVRPGRAGHVRAGFFVRENDGSVQSAQSYQEFNFPDRLAGVLDRPRAQRPATERRERIDPGRVESAATAPPLPPPRELPPLSTALEEEGPLLLPLNPPKRMRWWWLLAWAVVVGALGFGGYRYLNATSAPEPIGLTVSEHDGELQIAWNHQARPVTGAAHGSLAIVDGKQTRDIPLSPQDLAQGRFTYVRESGDIEVRLMVENAAG